MPCFQPPHLCHLSAQVLLGSLDSVIVGTKPERRLTQGSCFGFLLASVALSTLHWQCVGFILLSHLVIALLFSQVSEVKIGRNIHCFALQDNSLEHTEHTLYGCSLPSPRKPAGYHCPNHTLRLWGCTLGQFCRPRLTRSFLSTSLD